MIISIFAAIGLWVVMMIVTFILVCLSASSLNRKWTYERDETALTVSLITFIILLELVLCTAYISFKNHPETFGYTRIEQEIETEVVDE